MTDCTQELFQFPSFDRRKIEGSFTGGDVSSDGGVLLLRQADRRLGLTAALDRVLPDPRNPHFIIHRQVDLLRQRVYGLALATRTSTITPPCGATRPGKRRWNATRSWRRVPRSAGWKTGYSARRWWRFTGVGGEVYRVV